CYLAPLTLFFLIGPAAAAIATLIYATPPVIRLTAHGIRTVPATTLEATDSLGATTWQSLTQVMLPMAKRTIVLGANQTIMAALSMATITALIAAPGLGKVVIKALQSLDVGQSVNGGLAIVVMAIVLDRVTTAASVRAQRVPKTGRDLHLRRVVVGVGAALTAVAAYLSNTFVWAAEFPAEPTLGPTIRTWSENATEWVQDTFAPVTNAFKDIVTAYLLDPLQALLSESPWWLALVALVCLAGVLGGRRAVVTTSICLLLIVGLGLWNDAMVTLASTLLATIMVMAFGVVVGVWMGRSRRVDQAIRPILDAGQTLPAFVYLVPFLALFAASRFTAIAAALVYAAPASIKIIADGVRGLSATTMEAAASTGATAWQTIRLVQLPMAAKALALGANQGIIFVLAMVVVGGLVGAGALGYDVVAGLVQGQLYGKGLAAGVAISLLGIMLDRITQSAARRVDPSRPRG
ncbi:MAG TPA: ABC transporter permease subunit, partial [Candidatus Lustribacter sp.]|nr:ABC transporter permease subunit [Candidatus Lustribacter sp.]